MVKLIVLVVSLIISLGKNEIKEINATGVNPNEIILNAQRIAFATDGKILLTDKLFCRVNIYDKNLKLVSKIGKKGKGLGEFKAPSQIVCNDKYMVVSDFASSRVQVFNRSNNTISTFYTDGPIFNMIFGKDNNLLIGVYTGKKDRALFNYSILGKKQGIVQLKNCFGDPFKDIFKMVLLSNGYLAITYLVQNVVEILDENFKFYNSIRIKSLPIQPEYQIIKSGLKIPTDNIIQGIATDSKARIFILAANYVKMPKQEVFVYDFKGHYLKNFVLPNQCDEIFFDKDNNLYTIENNRTYLKKYKIRI